MRAVLDPNVLISAFLSPSGAPASLLVSWLHGEFELIVSPRLLGELERALAYLKLRKRISAEDAGTIVEWLGRAATVAPDPDTAPSVRSADPDDDYLLALAEDRNAALVSGDKHLLALADDAPIYSAADFVPQIGR